MTKKNETHTRSLIFKTKLGVPINLHLSIKYTNDENWNKFVSHKTIEILINE
jgi:hypothetical protein